MEDWDKKIARVEKERAKIRAGIYLCVECNEPIGIVEGWAVCENSNCGRVGLFTLTARVRELSSLISASSADTMIYEWKF